MNLGIFTGRLGANPTHNQTTKGEAVLNFSLATEVGTKAAPKTLWLDCSLFGKRAEILGQYLEKGTKVSVSGRIDMVDFKKRDGTPGTKLTLNVSDIDMHGSGSSGSSMAPAGEPAKADGYAPQRDGGINAMDDDIPF